ncbi:hypothetical protein J3Q64DRAFT_1752936 [Phycomyces blakesleeanus]|uniref:G-patch domain-containing protein n=1 Tax=Phycomyces blakesleeanus TaxID=4837 RepID=A0ABR3AUD3_PHYBL
MGLAGQKTKQRLSADPNNLNWSKDQSKFGFKMLMKMGWAPGKGLGVNEDGSKDHVKIKLKDDTLGLGASKKTVDNWLGNTDAFSQLLADLNTRTETVEVTKTIIETSETVTKRKLEGASDEDDEDELKEKKKQKKEKKDKKEKKEKKQKKEKKDKKEKVKEEGEEKKSKKSKKEKKEKKSKKSKDSGSEDEEIKQATTVLRNAARAKFLRSKRMSTQHDAARLNEILGIKPVVDVYF